LLHHFDFLRSTELLHSNAATLNCGSRSGAVGAIGAILLVGMTVGSSRSSAGKSLDNPSLKKDSSEAEEATTSALANPHCQTSVQQ